MWVQVYAMNAGRHEVQWSWGRSTHLSTHHSAGTLSTSSVYTSTSMVPERVSA